MFTEIDDPVFPGARSVREEEERHENQMIGLALGIGLITYIFIAKYIVFNWSTLRQILC